MVSRHCPRHMRLLLMLPASFRRGPEEISVLEMRSLPAKSTILRRDTEYLRDRPATSFKGTSTPVCSRRILIVNTLCERELERFAIVPKTERFSMPQRMSSRASRIDDTLISLSPLTNLPPLSASLFNSRGRRVGAGVVDSFSLRSGRVSSDWVGDSSKSYSFSLYTST